MTTGALILSLLAIGISLLKPWPFKLIVDEVLVPTQGAGAAKLSGWLAHVAASPHQAVLMLGLGFVVLQILWGALNLWSNFLFIRTGLEALMRLRTELYAYLQRLSLKYHDGRRSTDSSFRVAYDSQSIQTIYNKGLSGVFASGITLIGTLVLMLAIDWQLTLLSLAVIPFLLWAIYFFADRIRLDSTTIQEQESALLTAAQEGLSSVRMVHAFNRQDYELDQFRGAAGRSLAANLRLSMTTIQSALVVGILMALGTAILYNFGSLRVLDGKITIGDVILFSSYLAMLYQPLEALSYTAWALEGAAAGAQRCFEVLDSEEDVADSPDATPLILQGGALALRDVAFSYSADRPVLRGVDLEIPAGSKVALVGGTGAGKSTILSLLLRFYDPDAGKVLVDGQDLRTVTKRSLRDQMAVVLQDTILFSTTIRENIAYGRPDATDDEIREAIRRAEATGFIDQLPQGWDTPVGERGSHLSVGQRQRIGIARAFLKDAPILLLDEPTSALDPTTEAAIMRTLDSLMSGRTTVIVTHRIATIHHLDLIVALENGAIAEAGTGPELLARGGVYAKLHRSMSPSIPTTP